MKTEKAFVRTVLGDILPEMMGFTYSHEHIVIEESFPTLANPAFILNDIQKIGLELNDFYELGGRTMVDCMPASCGRNILKLAEISRQTKVNVIAATGMHLEKYYPPNHWRYHLSVEEITDLFIKDVMVGIDQYDYTSPFIKRTNHKAGMIKLATADESITKHQYKIFEAVVNTHLETGVPILTHTNSGKLAMEQVALFEKLGADLHHVVISHVDQQRDLSFHKDLFETGVYVEYDSHFRLMSTGDDWVYHLLESVLPDYSSQIVLGMDMAKNTYWKSYGGKPGLSYLQTEFREHLQRKGLGSYYKDLFYNNPQSLYSFTIVELK